MVVSLDMVNSESASIIILEAIMFPLIYKFGVEKGRIGIFVGIFGISLLIGFLLKNFNVDANNFIVFFDKYYYLIIPITLISFIIYSLYSSFSLILIIYVYSDFHLTNTYTLDSFLPFIKYL